MQAELDFVTPPWPKISAAAKDCVRQLLTVQVQSRPSASELLQVCCLTNAFMACGVVCMQIQVCDSCQSPQLPLTTLVGHL